MNDFPRRCQLQRQTPAEAAIRAAIAAVEAAGADVRLTEAVVLLLEARERVADFVDGVEWQQPPQDPVSHVRWVPIDKVVANDYNPNSVAKNEMRLLYLSIQHDGYTQPIVTIYDRDQDKYIIVDGFHRHLVGRTYKDIAERTGNRLPVVVIQKDINDRMASTVRHNRARGKHSVDGMANMVFCMLENGWADDAICNELGLEAEELVRLKHITGFSKLFENVEYKKAWETVAQVRLRHAHANEQASHPVT